MTPATCLVAKAHGTVSSQLYHQDWLLVLCLAVMVSYQITPLHIQHFQSSMQAGVAVRTGGGALHCILKQGGEGKEGPRWGGGGGGRGRRIQTSSYD